MLDELKIAMVADNCAELAALEAVGPLSVGGYLEIIYNQLGHSNVLLPALMSDLLTREPDMAVDVLSNNVLAAAGQPMGLILDPPAKVYFSVFAAVWRSLQPFKQRPVPPAAVVAAPLPNRGLHKTLRKSNDASTPAGFRKG